MPTEPLPTNYSPTVAYKVSGETLNRMNAQANSSGMGHVIQRGASGFNQVVKAEIPTVPFVFGIAKITGASDLCPTDSNEATGDGFPCRSADKYLVEFKVHNSVTGLWELYGESWEMECSLYFEALETFASKSPTSGAGYGPIPTYNVGDVTPAYLDVHRNKIIPVQSPYCDDPTAVFNSRDEHRVPIIPNIGAYAGFVLEMQRPGIDADFISAAVISIPLVYPDLGANTYASSSAFNTVPCPHGTLFRVREYRGNDASAGSDLVVTTIVERIRFTGIGRRSPAVVANNPHHDAAAGGDIHQGWLCDASTIHRFKDAPYFNVANYSPGQPVADLIQATYLDPLDEWMVGVELYVNINIAIDEFSTSTSPSSTSKSSTSVSSPSSQSSVSSLSSVSSVSSLSTTSVSSQSSPSSSNSSSTLVSTLSSLSSSAISTSASSQTFSASSSSSFDCFQFVQCVTFDPNACELTVTYGEVCFPRGSGITVSSDIPPPC